MKKNKQAGINKKDSSLFFGEENGGDIFDLCEEKLLNGSKKSKKS